MKNDFFLDSPEKAFVLLGLVFGLVFLFLSPPLRAPDEPNHFQRAYKISEGDFIPKTDQNGKVGDDIPLEVLVTILSLGHSIAYAPGKLPEIILAYQDPERFDLVTMEINEKRKEVIISLFSMPKMKQRVFSYFANTALYSPVSYLPQAAGIALGRAFALPPVALVYAGRFFSLCAWVLFVYLAIRIIPVFKWVLFLLALTPMSLYLASSLSADTVTTGLSFLLIAVFLDRSYADKKPLKAADGAIIVLLSSALSLSKFYFFIPLLFFLIPAGNFSSKKKYVSFFLLMYLSTVALTVVWFSTIKDFYRPGWPDVDPEKQMHVILSSPLRFLLIIVKTFVLRWKGIAMNFFGHLGCGDVFVPVWLTALNGSILFLAALSCGRKDTTIDSRMKLVIFAAFVLSTITISTAIYLSGTPVGGDIIVREIMGRYFIPISPLPLLLFYNKKNVIATNRLGMAAIGYTLFSLSCTALIILKGYYSIW